MLTIVLLLACILIQPTAALASEGKSVQGVPLDWSIDEDSWVLVTADVADISEEIETIEWTTRTVKPGGKVSTLFSDGFEPSVEFRAQTEGETTVTVNVVTDTDIRTGEITIAWDSEHLGGNALCQLSQSAPSELRIDSMDGGWCVRVPVEVTSVQPVNAERLAGWLDVPTGAKLALSDSSGRVLEPTERIATGCGILVTDENGSIVLKGCVVVAGDILGTGKIDMTQLVRLARVYTGKETLEEPYAYAASLSGQGSIALSDLVGQVNAYITLSAVEQ